MVRTKVFLAAGIFIALALIQGVSAYTSFDYSPRYGGEFYFSFHGDDRYGRYDSWSEDNFDEERYCEYWDRGELKWRRDRVCEWTNKGDLRESTLRTRAAIWQSDSYDDRYNIQAGRSSGDAYYYHYGDKSETRPSDWRYKTAFDPRVDNEYVMGHDYYYYEPRYDYKSGTFNWRY